MRPSFALVPALSAMLLAPSTVAAIEIGDLTIGGYVDTWLQISSYDEGAPAITDPDDDTTIDFAAEVELQFGWSIGSDVHAQIDLELYEGGGSYLETATVTWDITETASFMMGEFVDWLGWEAADAPGRYRINRTVLISEGNFYGTKTVTGAGLLGTPSDTMSFGLYVVDHVYGPKTLSDDLGIGGDLTIKIDGYGSVNVEFAMDMGGASSFGGSFEDDAFGIGVNTTYDAMEGTVIGAELHTIDYDVASSFGLMVIGNKTVSETASVSLQFAYLEPNDDVDDDEVIEVTGAILTTPTSDANFAVNYELSFIDRGDLGTGVDRGEVSAYVEFLAIIP